MADLWCFGRIGIALLENNTISSRRIGSVSRFNTDRTLSSLPELSVTEQQQERTTAMMLYDDEPNIDQLLYGYLDRRKSIIEGSNVTEGGSDSDITRMLEYGTMTYSSSSSTIDTNQSRDGLHTTKMPQTVIPLHNATTNPAIVDSGAGYCKNHHHLPQPPRRYNYDDAMSVGSNPSLLNPRMRDIKKYKSDTDFFKNSSLVDRTRSHTLLDRSRSPSGSIGLHDSGINVDKLVIRNSKNNEPVSYIGEIECGTEIPVVERMLLLDSPLSNLDKIIANSHTSTKVTRARYPQHQQHTQQQLRHQQHQQQQQQQIKLSTITATPGFVPAWQASTPTVQQPPLQLNYHLLTSTQPDLAEGMRANEKNMQDVSTASPFFNRLIMGTGSAGNNTDKKNAINGNGRHGNTAGISYIGSSIGVAGASVPVSLVGPVVMHGGDTVAGNGVLADVGSVKASPISNHAGSNNAGGHRWQKPTGFSKAEPGLMAIGGNFINASASASAIANNNNNNNNNNSISTHSNGRFNQNPKLPTVPTRHIGYNWSSGQHGYVPSNFLKPANEHDTWTLHKSYALMGQHSSPPAATSSSSSSSAPTAGLPSTPATPASSSGFRGPYENTNDVHQIYEQTMPHTSGFTAAKGASGSHMTQSLRDRLQTTYSKRLNYPPNSVDQRLYPTPLKLICVRHGERVDFNFGSTWAEQAFDKYGNYQRFNLNMPTMLPRRTEPRRDYIGDSPLTEIGMFQARLTGDALKQKGTFIQQCYSSPSFRCIQTAHNILLGMGLENIVKIRIEPGLFEFTGWYERFMPNFLNAEELIGCGFNIDLTHRPVIQLSRLSMDEKYLDYYNRSFKTALNVTSKHNNDGGNILFSGHAATLEVCTRQLCGFQPRSYQELNNVIRRVSYLGLGMCEKDLRDGIWRLKEPPIPPIQHLNNHSFDWKTM